MNKTTTQVLNHRESDGKCQFCKKVTELRLYGPKGEWVCFDCAMKDEESAKKRFGEILGKADTTILDVR